MMVMVIVVTMTAKETPIEASGMPCHSCPPLMKGTSLVCRGVNDKLEADEAEDDRQAVVEVDEPVEQPVDEEVELAQAQQGEGVGGEHQEGLAGQGVDRGDGVDGEHDVGGADGDDAQHHGR